jgi:hypothetical protein
VATASTAAFDIDSSPPFLIDAMSGPLGSSTPVLFLLQPATRRPAAAAIAARVRVLRWAVNGVMEPSGLGG